MPAIRTLRIENFQSIVDLTLELPEHGLIRLGGKSQIGKSSIVRALDVLYNNVIRKDLYIRDDCDYFTITATYYDDSYVTLVRGATLDYYEWDIGNGTVRMDKTKGKVPPVLTKFFNQFIADETTKINLNIQQRESPLPFSYTSPRVNYRLFQKSLGTDLLLRAGKLVNKDNTGIRSEINTYQQLLATAQLNVETTRETLAEKQQFADTLTKYNARLDTQLALVEQLTQLAQQLEAVQQLKADLATTVTVPSAELTALQNAMRTYSQLHSYLAGLAAMGKAITAYQALKAKLLTDAEKSTLAKTKDYLAVYQQLGTLNTQAGDLRRVLAGEPTVTAADLQAVQAALQSTLQLNSYLEVVRQYQTKAHEYQHSLDQAAESTAALNAFKLETKLCPYCGADMTAVHTH